MKNRVEQLRKELGLNQESFAKAIGVSRQTVSAIETGKIIRHWIWRLSFQIFSAKALKKFSSMKGALKMKKNNLITGVIYLLVGIGCLLTALLTETKLDALLFGFAGAGILPGLLLIHYYFYWSSPKHREQYQEKLDRENIEANDELKVKIRDKSGRYAYTLGLAVISVSTVVFAVLGSLEIVENAKVIVLYLCGYLAFQIVAGILIFNYMMKKY